jgi:hypothetical protein
MPKKKKKLSKRSIRSLMAVRIYGIWSRADQRIVFVSLQEEETEMEFDMEGYDSPDYRLVALETYYDVSSLESGDQLEDL